MNCLLPASFTTRSFIYDQAIYLFAEEYDMQTICPKSRTLLMYFICFFMILFILKTHIHSHTHFNSTFITSSISIICLNVFYFRLKNQMAVQVVILKVYKIKSPIGTKDNIKCVLRSLYSFDHDRHFMKRRNYI